MFKKYKNRTLYSAGKIVPIKLGLLKHVLRKPTNNITITLIKEYRTFSLLDYRSFKLIILGYLHAIRNFYPVMHSLFQYLASLEYNFYIVKQVQDNMFNCEELVQRSNLVLHMDCFANARKDTVYKSIYNKFRISNADKEGGYKNQHDNLVASNTYKEEGYKSQHDNLIASNTYKEGGYKICLA